MTDNSCWYLVWLAGSSAPFVVGTVERDGAVGVDGAGGLGVVDADGLGVAEGVVGVLERELPYSLLLPPTLVRLVPAAANSCCCAGVRPLVADWEFVSALLAWCVMLLLDIPVKLARSCCCWLLES